MPGSSKLIKILIVLIVVLVGYLIFSGYSTQNKIMQLQQAVKTTTDSLELIIEQYRQLEISYEKGLKELEMTKTHLNSFRVSVDSLLTARSKSVSQIQSALNSIIDNQDSIQKINMDSLSFRLK